MVGITAQVFEVKNGNAFLDNGSRRALRPKDQEAESNGSDNQNPCTDQRPSPSCRFGNRGRSCCRAGGLYRRNAGELFRKFRISQLVGVEVDDRNADAVLHFAFTKLVQMRTPL